MARRSHDDDDDAEKSRFRWLDAARYTVAAVVTVLIVAVIANAIKVVLRPDTLRVSVVGGSVAAKPMSPPSLALALWTNLLMQNPSGRAVMYYTHIVGYLFDNSTSPVTSAPKNDCFVTFSPDDVTVTQGREVSSFIWLIRNVTLNQISPGPFNVLSGGGIMRGVTLRLDGNLTTQTSSRGINITTRTTYYCPQVVAGGDPDDPAYQGNENVPCTSDGGSSRLLRRLWFSMLVPPAMVAAMIQTL